MAHLINISKFPDTSLITSFLGDTFTPSPSHLKVTEDVAIFASENRIVALRNVGDWEVSFSEKFNEDKITCVNLLSFEINHSLSYYIAVGFESGWTKFYLTEGGLCSKKWFAKGKVLEIRQEHRFKIDVIYEREIIQISPNDLHNQLRKGKAKIALQKATNSVDPESTVSSSDGIAFTKVNSNRPLSSATISESVQGSIFDQLVTASIIGGPNASVSAEPMAFEQICSTGDGVISGNSVILPRAPPSLSNLAVKNVGSIISSFWGGKKTADESLKIDQPEPPGVESVQERHMVYDLKRSGAKIVTRKGFSVVSDNLGRVWLLDNREKCISRVWKGYRNAQISFLSDSIVAILAPLRNIIELWPLYGTRIAAFNVPSNSNLSCDHLQERNILFSLNTGELFEVEVDEKEVLANLCSSDEVRFREFQKSCKKLAAENKFAEITAKFKGLTTEGQKLLQQKCELVDIVLKNVGKVDENLVVFLKSIDDESFLEEIKLIEDYLMFKNCKSFEITKKVTFSDGLSLSKFIENSDSPEMSEFIFKGLGDVNWRLVNDYTLTSRFLDYMVSVETVFKNVGLEKKVLKVDGLEDIDSKGTIIQESVFYSNINSIITKNIQLDKLLCGKNVPNVRFLCELILKKEFDEDEMDTESEMWRILVQRAQDTEKIYNLNRIGEQVSIDFLMKHSYEEIMAKWVALNFMEKAIQEIDWFKPNNETRFAGVVAYELAMIWTKDLASSDKSTERSNLANSINCLKNAGIIKILSKDSDHGYSVELAELIWKHIIAERVLELGSMVERVGHRPPISRITKTLGFQDVEEVVVFLEQAKIILDLIINGDQDHLKVGLTAQHLISPAWEFLEELDNDVVKSASVYSLVSGSQNINTNLCEIWRALVVSIKMVIEVDLRLRVKVERNQYVTLKPHTDLAGICPGTESNLPISLFTQGQFSRTEDLDLNFRREHFIEAFFNTVLKTVDKLPTCSKAELDDQKKSDIFLKYTNMADLLFADWDLVDSRERLYQDLSLKLVERSYDTIAMGLLHNIVPSPNILEDLLGLMGGRLVSWMYTRANPEESALVYGRMSESLKDFVEACEPQTNKPIVASSLSILDFLCESWAEKEHFCVGMSEIIRLIVDEALDPLSQ